MNTRHDDAFNNLRSHSIILQVTIIGHGISSAIDHEWGWLTVSVLSLAVIRAGYRMALKTHRTPITPPTRYATFHYNTDGTRKDQP